MSQWRHNLSERFQGPWPDEATLRAFLAALVAAEPEGVQHSLAKWQAAGHDWSDLADWLRRHGLLAMAYEQLRRLDSDGRYVRLIERLRAPYFQLAVATVRLLAQARELDQSLAASGVEMLFLKGVALAVTVYPRPNWRSMSDIDVLVRRRPAPPHSPPQTDGNDRSWPPDIADCVTLLAEEGFKLYAPEIRAGLQGLNGHHVTLAPPPSRRYPVELHWSLTDAQTAWDVDDMEIFWQRSRLITFEGHPYRILSPVAQLWHLSTHLALQHGLAEAAMKWLLDIHFLVQYAGAEIDGVELVAGARQLGWSAAVLDSLQWVQYLFATPVPAPWIEALRADAQPEIQRLIDLRAQKRRSLIDQSYVELRSFTGRARWRWLWSIAVPDPRYMRWRYATFTGWRLPLAYLYRWRQMLAGLGKTVSGRLRGGK
jgi:hypothetical protein